LIITGITCVDTEIEKKTEDGLGVLARADSPIHINRFAELVDAVHDYGTKLCVQLTAGMGRVAFGDILIVEEIPFFDRIDRIVRINKKSCKSS